jgi:hypothetical protein
MDRHMAASLDRWLTTDPWADYEPPALLHCTDCGGFLKLKPERFEPWSQEEQCNGDANDEYGAECGSWTVHNAHSFTVAAGTTEYRTCQRCGQVNTWVEV